MLKKQRRLLVALGRSALMISILVLVGLLSNYYGMIPGKMTARLLPSETTMVEVAPQYEALPVKEIMKPHLGWDSETETGYLTVFIPRWLELDDAPLYHERSYQWKSGDFELSRAGAWRLSTGEYVQIEDYRQTLEAAIEAWQGDPEQGVLLEVSYRDKNPGKPGMLMRFICGIIFTLSKYTRSLLLAGIILTAISEIVVFLLMMWLETDEDEEDLAEEA